MKMKNLFVAGLVALATMVATVSTATAGTWDGDYLLGGVYEDRFVHALIAGMLNGYVVPTTHAKNVSGEMFYSDAPEIADVKVFLAGYRDQTTSADVYKERVLLAFEYLGYELL